MKKTPWTLLLASACLAAAAARAQDLQVSATVDRNRLALNEQLVLQVSVAGNLTSLPEPQLPSLPNFNAYSSGRSHNLSIINGQMHSEAVYTYILTPRFVGRATIGPIGVEANGKRYSTAPIEIAVERPSQGGPGGAPSPAPASPAAGSAPRPEAGGSDIFARAEVDRREAYINQQVNLTIRFYTAVPLMGNPEYDPPQLQGFLSEDLPPNRTGQATINGRTYYYTEIKTALFPVEPGKASISPAVIKAQVQQGDIDPFAPDFFQRFFQQGVSMGQTREIRTEPLEIAVKALPEQGKPPSFQGAVGRFSVGAALDKRELKVGDALNLTFTVRGEGNLKTASPPGLPDLSNFRVFDAVSSLSLEKSGDVVKSVKEFKTVLVPKVSGLLTVPPIKYAVFDTARGAYVEQQTPAMAVKVAPGAAPAAPEPGAETAPEALPVSSDIRYIAESRGRPLDDRLLFPLTANLARHLAPLAALLIALGVRAAGLKERDGPKERRRRAYARARAAVKAAEREFERRNPARAAAGLSQAVADYLADKVGEEARGLPFRKRLEAFSRRYPSSKPESLEALRKVYDDLELLRFSPGGSPEGPPLTERVSEVLQSIEKEAAS